MTVYRLTDDFFDDSYGLIAIHSSLDSYRLAYFLNRFLGVKLLRLKKDLLLYEEAAFEIYETYDENSGLQWDLISNRTSVVRENMNSTPDMFGVSSETKVFHVLPEYAKVDHLLKIDDGEGGVPELSTVLKTIKQIPGVITAYELDADQLKSKNNLIFLENAE